MPGSPPYTYISSAASPHACLRFHRGQQRVRDAGGQGRRPVYQGIEGIQWDAVQLGGEAAPRADEVAAQVAHRLDEATVAAAVARERLRVLHQHSGGGEAGE